MNRIVGTAAPWLLSCSLLALMSAGAQAQQVPVGAAPAAGASPASGAVPPGQAAPANEPKPGAEAKAANAAPTSWADGIKVNLQFEGGAIINPANPDNGLNFGQLFTDRANQFVMNQALFTVQRPIDPKSTDFDIGFKFQALYGTDARYTSFMGELNHTFASKYQLSFIEANLAAHMPIIVPGGVDVKIGQWATPLGYETIDPSTNPFYSHSYIFNFGLPLVQTGILSVTHATSNIDVYLGIDTGVNTTFGAGDNNSAVAGTAGFGLTFLDGKLTVLALSHFGPENPSRTVPNADSFYRYLNDIVVTYKASDALSFTTELNLIRDDFGTGHGAANGYGVAQYVSYTLNDNVALNARAEIFRDDNGFFVAGFRGYRDFYNLEYGNPAPGVVGVGPATYSEVTLGLTYKPTLPAPISGLMIRPEVRYDYALTNTKAYNNGADRGVFTFGTDFVLSF